MGRYSFVRAGVRVIRAGVRVMRAGVRVVRAGASQVAFEAPALASSPGPLPLCLLDHTLGL